MGALGQFPGFLPDRCQGRARWPASRPPGSPPSDAGVPRRVYLSSTPASGWPAGSCPVPLPALARRRMSSRLSWRARTRLPSA